MQGIIVTACLDQPAQMIWSEHVQFVFVYESLLQDSVIQMERDRYSIIRGHPRGRFGRKSLSKLADFSLS